MKKNHIILALILFAIATRIALPPLFTHLPNFSPIDATALFCGAYFRRYFIAVLVTLASVWIGDLFINKIMTQQWVLFYEGSYWQYGCYALITLIGYAINHKPLSIFFASMSASLLFFIISNFGVWFSGTLYPHTIDGLVACYIAALPFLKYTLCSDLLFVGLLFGAFTFIHKSDAQCLMRRI